MTSAIRWRVFILGAITINLIAFLMARLAPRPAVEIGAALDAAVTVPALYFLLIVRGGLQPLASLLPIGLLGLLRASYLSPGMVGARPAIGAAVELAIAALIVGRVRRATRASASLGGGDTLERLEAAARQIVPSQRMAAVLAGEMAVFYYAFASWPPTAQAPAGGRVFSIHRESGVADLFGLLAAVSVIEATLVHLVVMRWSVAAAWTLTALSVYGAVWLLAAARAFVLRPVLVEGSEVVVRGGILWTVRVPFRLIAGVKRVGSEAESADCELRVPLACQSNLALRLSETVTARGMYGMTRQVTNIALAVDDREGLVRALTHGN